MRDSSTPGTGSTDVEPAPENAHAEPDALDRERRAAIRRLGAYGATLPVAMQALLTPETARAQGGSEFGGSDAAP